MKDEVEESALRMLARREHSCFELKQKLLQKKHTAIAIEPVLQKLLDQNLISDERFTESYIRSRTAKGYGPLKIRAELHERGINRELITKFLNQKNNQDSIELIRVKKFGPALPNNNTDKAKQIRYLQYKGFSWEEIQKIFK